YTITERRLLAALGGRCASRPGERNESLTLVVSAIARLRARVLRPHLPEKGPDDPFHNAVDVRGRPSHCLADRLVRRLARALLRIAHPMLRMSRPPRMGDGEPLWQPASHGPAVAAPVREVGGQH